VVESLLFGGTTNVVAFCFSKKIRIYAYMPLAIIFY